MRKLFLFFLLLLAAEVSFSQTEKKQFIHKGLLRATATISPGNLLKQGDLTIYLHGNLEYYVADNVSVRGDSYFDMNSWNNKNEGHSFEYNHSIFSGVSYHFKTNNHFDPYFGLEPGISLAKRNDLSGYFWDMPVPNYYLIKPKQQISPLISPLLGFNYYFQNYFHLFMETRYVYGKHLCIDGAPPRSLSELRFSFGLGFNLSILKPK